jgi:hypothetical protein
VPRTSQTLTLFPPGFLVQPFPGNSATRLLEASDTHSCDHGENRVVFPYLEALVATGLRVFAALVVLAVAWGWYRLLMRRDRAPGVVAAHEEGRWYRRKYPRPSAWRQHSNTAWVAFIAGDGTEYEVPVDYPSGGGDDYSEGQVVTVVYQRSNPRNAVIDEGHANYTDMIFATVVVVGFVVWYVLDRLF